MNKIRHAPCPWKISLLFYYVVGPSSHPAGGGKKKKKKKKESRTWHRNRMSESFPFIFGLFVVFCFVVSVSRSRETGRPCPSHKSFQLLTTKASQVRATLFDSHIVLFNCRNPSTHTTRPKVHSYSLSSSLFLSWANKKKEKSPIFKMCERRQCSAFVSTRLPHRINTWRHPSLDQYFLNPRRQNRCVLFGWLKKWSNESSIAPFFSKKKK